MIREFLSAVVRLPAKSRQIDDLVTELAFAAAICRLEGCLALVILWVNDILAHDYLYLAP